MKKIEGVVPDVEMDFGVLYARYAMILNKEMDKAARYNVEGAEAMLPPAALAAITNGMKALVSIQADKRAAEREKEELTDKEKLAFIIGLLEDSPQLSEEVRELLPNA